MNKSILSLITLALLIASCTSEKKQDPFQVTKHNIGLLTDSTQVKDLNTIYNNDSIVKSIKGDEFISNANQIDIFDTTGKKLLVLTPSQALDSTSVIESVQIIDPRYKTDKNITKLSVFKDIQDNYTISRIDNLINSVVISVNEINASFTIDKKELPANLRFDMNLNIDAVQIPDGAKIKYFMLHW
ncbi:hypothetical protein [Ichthyenterobacterium magnum]|uniref:Uncharacterized protein n=1 Tax=Ichthyenterobacterium magnum TaxID=1230530 RepID=A0A420DFR7_9FLAO|nr:hypothetical protein [Ichthyenterobacterium magnum]RKE90889.1 hypothetical protein BXY80_2479 [Ichthyenterobacterium magnum]